MNTDHPPIITAIEAFLGWTMDRTAGFPKSQRFTFGQRIDSLSLQLLEHGITARFDAPARARELRALNLDLEKLRVLWRIVQGRGWITARQLLFAAGRIDEIGRMAGGWLKATPVRSP